MQIPCSLKPKEIYTTEKPLKFKVKEYNKPVIDAIFLKEMVIEPIAKMTRVNKRFRNIVDL